MRLVFIAALAAFSAEVPASGESFTYGEDRFEAWTASARVYLRSASGAPFADRVQCTIETEDGLEVQQSVGGDGGMQPTLVLTELLSRVGSVRAVEAKIGSNRYELRWISTRRHDRFANLSYPPGDDIWLTFDRGYYAYRKHSGHPWLPIEGLLEPMIGVPWVTFEFQGAQADGASAPHIRKRVEVGGLREALNWCQARLASDEWRTLPDHLRPRE